MTEIIHTQWACTECAAGGTVSVTSYVSGAGLIRTIPHTVTGGLDPHITIKCPRCSGAGCVVGYEPNKWNISKEWLEARLAEYDQEKPCS